VFTPDALAALPCGAASRAILHIASFPQYTATATWPGADGISSIVHVVTFAFVNLPMTWDITW